MRSRIGVVVAIVGLALAPQTASALPSTPVVGQGGTAVGTGTSIVTCTTTATIAAAPTGASALPSQTHHGYIEAVAAGTCAGFPAGASVTTKLRLYSNGGATAVAERTCAGSPTCSALVPYASKQLDPTRPLIAHAEAIYTIPGTWIFWTSLGDPGGAVPVISQAGCGTPAGGYISCSAVADVPL